MKTHNPFVSLAILSITALLIASGCSSSSSPSGTTTNPAQSVRPKLGTTFTDSVSIKDTSLNNKPGISVTYTLVDTNATVQGKTGVYVFASNVINPASGKLDTVFQYYETNNDLSVIADFSAAGYDVGEEWVTFPVASQDSVSINTLSAQVVIYTVTISGYAKGTGTANQTIVDTSRYTESAALITQAVSAIGTIPATVKLTYAPSLGIVTYQDLTQTGSVSGQNISGGHTAILTGYSMK